MNPTQIITKPNMKSCRGSETTPTLSESYNKEVLPAHVLLVVPTCSQTTTHFTAHLPGPSGHRARIHKSSTRMGLGKRRVFRSDSDCVRPVSGLLKDSGASPTERLLEKSMPI
ncbi:hypothetical protein PGT21_025031 [Puccinia graminis f. sp. tritici]|uniref:Uncharacterized protein n=1 Tax=Puccinia graminis f. sp. tritici TaxID=56615 RepID=A0A5B0P9T9_PUCGR|nr:hypothetical protein PGT21_025031 [Puccinia graminis f. sp. tritici]